MAKAAAALSDAPAHRETRETVAEVVRDPERAEDDRDHDRLDHPEKEGRERLELERGGRRQPSEEDPGAHPDEDPVCEREIAESAEHQRPTSVPALASIPARREV